MPENNGLSDREIEILRLVATGASNKEIANQLFISTNTVKVHLRNIFAKIGVESRTEAAMYVVNHGLLIDQIKPEELSDELLPVENGFAGQSGIDLSETDLVVDQAQNRGSVINRSIWIPAMILGSFLLIGVIWIVINQILGNQLFGASIADLEANRWTFGAEMSAPRQGMAAVSFNNQIIAIGGETEAGIVDLVEGYDTNALNWIPLASKPTPATDISAVMIGGKIYVPGGLLASGQVSKELEIYDPREDKWSKGAPLPVGLSEYALAALEGNLYLFGGWNGAEYVNTVFAYNPTTNHWTSKANLGIARGSFGAATIGGKIYLIGGKDAKHSFDLVESYSPDLDSGTGTPWVKQQSLPVPRSGMGVIGIADYIYVLGQDDLSVNQPTALYYNSQLDQWTEFKTPVELPWSKMGVVAVGNFLYAIGGALNDIPTAQNLSYQAVFTVLLPVVR